MIIYFYLVLVFLVSYLMGSIPTAYIITKKTTGKDIRDSGTGNVGAMNVSRTTGKKSLFFFTFLGDALKGTIPVYLAKYVLPFGSFNIWAAVIAGFGVVLGHCYSIYFKLKEGKFSGGKAVASMIGILPVLSFKYLFLPWAIIGIVSSLVTQMLFFGQFMMNISLPFIGYFLAYEYFWFCVLAAIPIFFKQRSRIIPMFKGKEAKGYWGKRVKEN
jgi:glycerol-3-phosphate acyltransferase PlsY